MSEDSHTDKKGFSFSTPMAIVVAGVLVAGSILAKDYVFKSPTTKQQANEPAKEEVLAERNPQAGLTLGDLAKQIGLDESKFASCLAASPYFEQVEKDNSEFEKATEEIAKMPDKGRGVPAYFINDRFVMGAYSYRKFKEFVEDELSGKRSLESSPDFEIYKVSSPVGYGESDPVKGDETAKITIIEFSDFLCPFCGASAGSEQGVAGMKQRDPSWEPIVPTLIKEYVDTGKVRLVFRNYTRVHGEGAVKLANAALCAKDQGKYWEMHDAIFANQANLEVQ